MARFTVRTAVELAASTAVGATAFWLSLAASGGSVVAAAALIGFGAAGASLGTFSKLLGK